MAITLRGGYHGVSRESTLEEFADELDVSHRALSERPRRGRGSLVRNTLTTGSG